MVGDDYYEAGKYELAAELFEQTQSRTDIHRFSDPDGV